MTGWAIPDVIRQELKVHQTPIFNLTLHVRKTWTGQNGAGKRMVPTISCIFVERKRLRDYVLTPFDDPSTFVKKGF